MGFHKRFITKEGILNNIQNLETYFDSDALIFDSWSSKFYEDIDPEERQIRKEIIEDNAFLGGCPDQHRNYYHLDSLAETLISLKTNPNWLDIHFTKQKLGLQFSNEISGVFEDQVKSCIDKIIEYYEHQ
jgi:hypothetical protein